jgi:hypothetical protein
VIMICSKYEKVFSLDAHKHSSDFSLLWLATGLNDTESFNFMKFNILPVPMIGDMIVFGLMLLILLGIQKLKEKVEWNQR